MTTRMVSVCVSILLGLSASATLVRAQENTKPQDNTKAAVVRIENTKREEVGTGFIVRIVSDKIYIVTAAHVVRGDQHPKVYLFTRQDEGIAATVVDREEDDLKGLALLRLTADSRILAKLAELKLRATDDLGNGNNVTFIGFPDSTSLWTVDKGNIKRLEGRNLVLSGSVRPGYSGGPVILNQQAVGLITDVTQTDIYAVRAEVLVPYVNGFVSNLISISPKSETVDEFCQTLKTLIDSSKGGFYSIVGGASNQEGTFFTTMTLPGALGGYVRPDKSLYFYLAHEQVKGKTESLFYSSIARIRPCLAGWEEKETIDSVYRYHKFRQHDGGVTISIRFNPTSQDNNYWVILEFEL